MDLGELWSKVQTTASEIAAAAEETAARAYTAVEETGEMAAKSEAWLAMSSQFAKLQSDASFTFAELRARAAASARSAPARRAKRRGCSLSSRRQRIRRRTEGAWLVVEAVMRAEDGRR